MHDKAGKKYWDENWRMLNPDLVDPTTEVLANEANRRFHNLFTDIFDSTRDAGKMLLEVGCAKSYWLPYFARYYGLIVSGLDYSEEGCQQEEMLLARACVQGQVVCADLFSPPDEMIGKYDYILTVGVVEHFTDTSACISALEKFLKPGGTAITIIPNMYGTTGALQYICDSSVYDTHVPITPEDLGRAHEEAGFTVSQSKYYMSTNYYVVNSMHRRGSSFYIPIKLFHSLLGRLSMCIWYLERIYGELPARKLFSPYVICVAQKNL